MSEKDLTEKHKELLANLEEALYLARNLTLYREGTSNYKYAESRISDMFLRWEDEFSK